MNSSSSLMRSRTMLLLGVAAVTISIGGMMIGASGSGWGGHMPESWHMAGSGHMGSWSPRTDSASPIEGAAELTVTANDFSFSPSELVVTQGEAVNLVFVNDGAITHDLSIPELSLRVVAGAGQSATEGFVPDRAGSYDVVCTYPGHAASGMTGTLVVRDI